jgi:hypothetical protein
MRLFEFADADPLRVKLAAITNQLKSRVEKTNRTLSTDELLSFFRDNDIVLDQSDLFDIVKKEPLKNIIRSVNKDEVIFKGQESEVDSVSNEPEATDDSEKVRQQMAKKAMK